MKPHRRTVVRMSIKAVAAALAAAFVFCQPAGAAPEAAPREGIDVGQRSRVAELYPAQQLERSAAGQYHELLREASSKGALAPPGHPQLQRLRRIADRIIPQAPRFNARAPQWQWEVNLIGSKQVNAFCMPGGKIAFFSGIIDSLKLTDDEIAAIMGHEVAHALREHGRERAAKSAIANGVTIGASVLSQVLGYGDLGGQLASAGAKLTMLKFSRGDETEADLVGMDLAARAGFDPRAGVKLWEKMAAVSKGQPPQWLSTHPSHERRVDEIRKHLDATLPLYAKATGQSVAALPPYRSNYGDPIR